MIFRVYGLKVTGYRLQVTGVILPEMAIMEFNSDIFDTKKGSQGCLFL